MTRVRVVAGPWPERIGCVGTIVEAPPGYDRYPWHGRGKGEVIVLLDDDPLVSFHTRHDPSYYGGQGWTCAIVRDDLEVL